MTLEYAAAPFPLIDSHAHLDELLEVQTDLREAKKAGIIAVVAPGQNRDSNAKLLKLSTRYPGYVFPCAGYHPWNLNIQEYEDVLDEIDATLDNYIALGEIGLDYKAKVKKADQKRIFALLLEIAKRHEKPVIIHTRYVHETTFSMIRDYGLKQAVFHSYNGSLDLLDQLTDCGYFISAAPSVCYNEAHANAVRRAPLDRLLLETDTPISWRNCIARPIHTYLTLHCVAKLKGISAKIVAEQTVKNTIVCFGLGLKT